MRLKSLSKLTSDTAGQSVTALPSRTIQLGAQTSFPDYTHNQTECCDAVQSPFGPRAS